MKHIITSLCMLIACSVFAQKKISENTANPKVREAYFRDNSKHTSKDVWTEYPDKYTIVWVGDAEDPYTYTYTYLKNGQWLNRTRPVEQSMLSPEITQDLATRYPGYAIQNIIVEISDNGKFYVVTLTKDQADTMNAYYIMSGSFDHDAKVEKPAANEKPAKAEKPKKEKKAKKEKK